MAQAESDYPVQFSVDYPDRDLNRLTTFFRIFTVIPIVIVLVAVSGGSSYSWAARDETFAFGAGAGGILFFGPLLLIVFRQKYPRWWFDWNLNLAASRTGSFLPASFATSIRRPTRSRRSSSSSGTPTCATISTAGCRW